MINPNENWKEERMRCITAETKKMRKYISSKGSLGNKLPKIKMLELIINNEYYDYTPIVI